MARKTVSLNSPSVDRLMRLVEYYDLPPSAVIRMLIAEKFSQLMREPSLAFKLPVTLEREEDGSYLAICPILAGCHALGDTVEEALGEIVDVARTLLEVMQEDSKPWPPEFQGFDLCQPLTVEVNGNHETP